MAASRHRKQISCYSLTIGFVQHHRLPLLLKSCPLWLTSFSSVPQATFYLNNHVSFTIANIYKYKRSSKKSAFHSPIHEHIQCFNNSYFYFSSLPASVVLTIGKLIFDHFLLHPESASSNLCIEVALSAGASVRKAIQRLLVLWKFVLINDIHGVEVLHPHFGVHRCVMTKRRPMEQHWSVKIISFAVQQIAAILLMLQVAPFQHNCCVMIFLLTLTMPVAKNKPR